MSQFAVCPACGLSLPVAGAQCPRCLLDGPMPARIGPVEGSTVADGRYELVRLLGSGGMGSVWLARQREPVLREVALKIIKAGMDTVEFVARFNAERQALAMMDHPGIARVYEAGALEDGRPYYVMERVDGLPVTDYCGQARMGIRGRLDLLVHICHAVRHAHQRGIIHRDLKPSNVLVAVQDGQPSPKVIDFGLAKALREPLAHSLLTLPGQMMGTPLYASPEQFTGSDEADTRADIYALGVIMYELLTGTTPLPRESMAGITPVSLAAMIAQHEPPRPSVRAAAGSPHSIAWAAALGETEKSLASRLRGDLDWIVMKALEKDRERRYDSAAALADDIERHLSHQTVMAAPPGAGYRVRRFVRRHRFGIGAAAAVLITLIGGLAAAIWQAVRARDAEEDALTRGNHAVQARDAAQRLVKDTLYDLRVKLEADGRSELLNDVAGATDAYFSGLPEDLRTRDTEGSRGIARMVRGDVLALKGDSAAALAAYEAALLVFRKLAGAESSQDDFDFRRDVALLLNRTGAMHRAAGRLDEALRRHREALAICETLVAERPRHPKRQSDLAACRERIGEILDARSAPAAEVLAEYEASLAANQRALAADSQDRSRRRDVSAALLNIADVRRRMNDVPAALDAAREALKLREALAKEQPGQSSPLHDVAVCHDRLSLLFTASGDKAGAHRSAQSFLATMRRLAALDPDHSAWQRDLSVALNKMGRVPLKSGDFATALPFYTESLTVIERLSSQDPANAQWQSDLIYTLLKLAEARAGCGDTSGAVPLARRAHDLLAALPAGAASEAQVKQWQQEAAKHLAAAGAP